MLSNAKIKLYFTKLKDKPFFKEKNNIIIRLKKKSIMPKNIWNWFYFTLKGKTERIYYILHFKIIPLLKYSPFIL